ncbi:MAG: flagellar export chaperone FlgN [Planctomycetes bacterium]|nr:flagellar export chaperone FlgN [Planctomycetota bacterium]
MTTFSAEQILDALRQEADACRELAALRSEQRQLIDADKAEELLTVLARKQKAINRVGRLEEMLKPVKADWETRRCELPPLARVEIAEAFRQVRDLLEELIARETEDAEVLAGRKDAAEKELATFDSKRRLETTYRAVDGRSEGSLLNHLKG